MFGALSALVALFGWGFGDAYIQRTTRLTGVYAFSLYIGAIGTVFSAPFAWIAFRQLNESVPWTLFLSMSLFTALAWLIHLEALKLGKLSVVGPIIALELPFALVLAQIIHQERLLFAQWMLIGVIFLGSMLIAFEHEWHPKRSKRVAWKLSSGVLWAIIAAIGSAMIDVSFGIASESVSVALTFFVTHAVFFVLVALTIALRREWSVAFNSIRTHFTLASWTSVIDLLAWTGYGFASSSLGVSLAVAISQPYVAVESLIGIFWNKERPAKHQIAGLVLMGIGVAGLIWTTL